MAKWCALLVVLSACCTGAYSQETSPNRASGRVCPVPETEKAIHRIADEWKSAYNAGDPDKVASLYAPDAYYLTQHFITGIVDGRNAIRAYVKKGTDAKYRVDSLKVLASGCNGDFAYAITRYESMNNGQKAVGVNLVVLKKIDNLWRIVAHEAAVPDVATAIQTLNVE